jgi:hypothetical protein
MKPYPKQSDLDSQIAEIDSPMALFWQLAALSTGLIVVIVWLALIGAMAAGWLAWSGWLFITAPIAVWLCVLALPVLYHAQRGAVAIVAMLAKTAEAWLARAGYSIDLNRDGYIGWQEAQPLPIAPPERVRPLLVKSYAVQGVQLLASDTPNPFDGPASDPAPTPARPKLWTLPNGATLPQSAIEQFIDGIFVRGWSRSSWVGRGKALEREQYEGLISLLEQTGILVDRKAGAAGRLAIHTAAAARSMLRLSPAPADGQGQADGQDTSQARPARARASQVDPVSQVTE